MRTFVALDNNIRTGLASGSLVRFGSKDIGPAGALKNSSEPKA